MAAIEFRTLTGLDLVDAFKRLDDVLPPNAYKAVSGGKGGTLGLTDIKPGYMPPLLLELFGPCGYGWGYSLNSIDTTARMVKRGSGKEEEEYTSICQIEVWYRFQVNGETIKSDGIPARGGSSNTQLEWAEKGAITYALGTAWFLAGYQVAVYKGERSHKDFVGKTQPRQQPQNNQKPPQRRPVTEQPKAPDFIPLENVLLELEGAFSMKDLESIFKSRLAMATYHYKKAEMDQYIAKKDEIKKNIGKK